MAKGGTEVVGGYIGGDRGDDGSGYVDIKGGGNGYGDGYGDGSDRASGSVPLEDGGGADADGILRGTAGGVIHLARGGTNLQGGRRLLWYWPGEGGIEGGDGHYQFTPHHLH